MSTPSKQTSPGIARHKSSGHMAPGKVQNSCGAQGHFFPKTSSCSPPSAGRFSRLLALPQTWSSLTLNFLSPLVCTPLEMPIYFHDVFWLCVYLPPFPSFAERPMRFGTMYLHVCLFNVCLFLVLHDILSHGYTGKFDPFISVHVY